MNVIYGDWLEQHPVSGPTYVWQLDCVQGKYSTTSITGKVH